METCNEITEFVECPSENENLNCASQREELLNKIMSCDFSLVELGLFLDTHPNCEKALAMHNEYANKNKKLKDTYQKLYGPLSMDYPCNSWRWGKSPWPWERGF